MNYARPRENLSAAPPRTMAEFRARQAALIQAKRATKAARRAFASHTSTSAPTRWDSKSGKRAHKADMREASRHQSQAGPRSPSVPGPSARAKQFRFVPYHEGAQAIMRKQAARPV